MRNRIAIAVGAITFGLMVTGIAWAAQDAESTENVSDESGSTSSTGLTTTSNTAVTSTTAVSSSPLPTGSTPTAPATAGAVNGAGTLVLAEGQVGNVLVDDAGSVLLRRSGGSLTILSTQANAGWVVEVEVGTGREVQGDFRNGDRRVKFNFELEDGVIRIRIESEGSTSGGSATSTTGSTGTTNTTTSTTGTTGATGTTNTTAGSAALPTGSVTYNLDGAGTVTVVFANASMSIGSISPAAGWTIDNSEQRSDEIRVELTNGDSEAELRVLINNGQAEVEIHSKSS